MKVGIMQPYFFPYIGYWQLMNEVDKYVIYDDVNYINRGWINRNRILVDGSPKYFNVPLLGASQNKLIKEIKVNLDEKKINRNMSIIKYNYKKAPYFELIYPLISEILNYKFDILSEYLTNSIKIICQYLEINTEIIMSSNLKKDNRLKGEIKILAICKELETTDYYNAIGGKDLYHFNLFAEHGIKLHFLKTNEIRYKQFDNEFQPSLSIIDVLMFNSHTQVKEMLHNFTLVEK